MYLGNTPYIVQVYPQFAVHEQIHYVFAVFDVYVKIHKEYTLHKWLGKKQARKPQTYPGPKLWLAHQITRTQV